MRDYNYRRDKQEKFVKQRILNIAYQEKHYNYAYRRYSRHGQSEPNCSKKDPEDKWFNYLGEYTPEYKKSNTFDIRKYKTWWGDWWKEKYLLRRSRLKKFNIKELDEQIGQTYYIFNKF
jgi:hypothetical protein